MIGNKNTGTVESQLQRWKHQINKWSEINDKNEVITMGDINLNSLEWHRDVNDRTPHDRSLAKQEILEHETTKLNNAPTWNLLTNPKCLDRMYVNKPQTIEHFSTVESIYSDHTIQILIREGKIKKSGPPY